MAVALSMFIFLVAFISTVFYLSHTHTHTEQHAVNHTHYVEAGSVKATTAKLHPPSAVLSCTGLAEPPGVIDSIT